MFYAMTEIIFRFDVKTVIPSIKRAKKALF
jgi:hypothetical protein